MIKALLIVFIVVVVGALVLQSCVPVSSTQQDPTTIKNMSMILETDNYQIWRFTDSSGSNVTTCWLSVPRHTLYPPNIFCK